MIHKLRVLIQSKRAALWLHSHWAVAALCAVVAFGVLSPVLVFGETTFLTNLDNVDQFYTWYQKLATSVHDGYLPVWNANVFAGQSFAGELQPGVFYPLNLLWVWLFGSGQGISQLVIDYLVAAHFALAAFGAYLLFAQLGARRWAAFLSGVIFAFSGAVAFRSISQTAIFFGMALLPYPLYFLAKFYSEQKQRLRWLLAGGAFLGLIILAGHIAPFFFAVVALGLFELSRLYKGFAGWRALFRPAGESLKHLALILGCAGLVALPQLWVSVAYLPNAYRIQAGGYVGPGDKLEYGEFAKAFNLDMHEFINLVDPVSYQIRDGNNLFIGLAPLAVITLAIVLAGAQLKKTELWARHKTLVTALLVLSIVAMLGYVTWFAVVLYELPFVYQVRQLGRYSILFHVALLAVLAMALPVVAGLQLTRRQKWVVGLAGGFLLVNALYLFLLRQHIFSLHHALQVGLLSLTLLSVSLLPRRLVRRVALGTLLIATAAVNTLWFLPNIKADTKVPSSYELPAKLVGVLEQTNGRYRVEIQSDAVPVNIGNVYDVQTIGGYAATVYAPYYEFAHDPRLDPELRNDLLGVQYIVTKQEPLPGQEIVYADPGIYVIQRPTVLPKFFTVTNPGSTARAAYQPLDVQLQRYSDRYAAYIVTTHTATTAIISEIAYDGWVAKVDGRTVPLKTYAIGGHPVFRSLELPKGTHKVEVLYKPFKFF